MLKPLSYPPANVLFFTVVSHTNGRMHNKQIETVERTDFSNVDLVKEARTSEYSNNFILPWLSLLGPTV